MLEGPESLKSAHKLVLQENVSISAFYTVILGEMDPKVTKLVNLTQNWTFRPLIRPVKYQQVMLAGFSLVFFGWGGQIGDFRRFSEPEIKKWSFWPKFGPVTPIIRSIIH